MRGESVSLDGDVLLLLLVVLGVVVAATGGVLLAGCVWAVRAGEGSQPALAGLIAVGVVEAAALRLAIPSVRGGEITPLVVVPALAMIVQLALYLRARAR